MIKKILGAIILVGMIIQPAWAVTQFTTVVPASTGESASNFPAEIYANWAILQTLLQNYRQGYYLLYDNSTTLTIGAGEVSVWNGTSLYMLQNTGSQTATTANLDTGASFSGSTTYYVYATSSSSTQATATIVISLNNSAPSTGTYYKQLGYFVTDSNGNISQIIDNAVITRVGVTLDNTYTANNPYQATTDGLLVVQCNSPNSFQLVSDSSPSPTTYACGCSQSNGTANCSVLIRKGNYWKVNGTLANLTWTPLGQ